MHTTENATDANIAACEAAVTDYLADNGGRNAIVARDLIEHGWSAASAHAAEVVREFVEQAIYRVNVLGLDFDWRVRLEDLARELEDGIGA